MAPNLTPCLFAHQQPQSRRRACVRVLGSCGAGDDQNVNMKRSSEYGLGGATAINALFFKVFLLSNEAAGGVVMKKSLICSYEAVGTFSC